MNIQEERAHAMALAGGAIVTALLDTLVEKNVLSVREARALLLKSMNGISTYTQLTVGYEASGMIAAMMRDRFPQSGPSGAAK